MPKDIPKRISWEEAISLTESLYRDGKFKEAAAIRTNLHFGLRIGDFQKFVTWHSVMNKNRFECIPMKTQKKKKRCTRPISDDLRGFVSKCWMGEGYPEGEQPIWINKGKTKACTDQSINKTMKRWIELYDLRDPGGDEINPIHFSTHSIRKTAAWKVYEATGFNIEAARTFLLHDSIEVTRKYLGVEANELNNILESIY